VRFRGCAVRYALDNFRMRRDPVPSVTRKNGHPVRGWSFSGAPGHLPEGVLYASRSWTGQNNS
jgi:hypothetical protein